VARQRVLEVLTELQSFRTKTIAALTPVIASVDQLSRLRHLLDDVAATVPSPAVSDLLDRIEAAIQGLGIATQAVEAVPVSTDTQTLKIAFEREDETYYQLRQQQQIISESLKREETARRRLSELERIERDVGQLESEAKGLLQRRQVSRAQITRLRDQIFELRVAEASKINEEFGDVILLAVKRAAHSREYVDKLSTLLAGSRIRTQGNLAEELATHLSVSDLLQIVEDGDAQRLARLLSRDLGQITRLTSYLRDHPDLYDLERNVLEDSLEITMFDQGQAKPVEQLSEGQRATALLPLILRQSSCPLIIDQPEDDLDNSFIFQVLVKKVETLKSTRQLIFVTHNANIPVLGEAEQIVVMHMSRPTKAAPPRSGSLDQRKEDVLDLLEGGKEAFEYREKRYKDLLQ
jgi:ABC-type enterochelin transport system ATPase subunit